jgi:hypothetical protein
LPDARDTTRPDLIDIAAHIYQLGSTGHRQTSC